MFKTKAKIEIASRTNPVPDPRTKMPTNVVKASLKDRPSSRYNFKNTETIRVDEIDGF